MKYWVYLNEKVTGPFTADKLVTLNGFTPDTLICSEESANSGNQAWVKASSIFEFEQSAPASMAAPVAAAAATTAAGNDSLTSMLLAKIEALTTQLSGMQSKLDGVQSKLDESISSQQKAAQESAERANELAKQFNSLASSQHDLMAQIPKPVTNIPTEDLTEQTEDLAHTLPTAAQDVQPALQENTQTAQPEETPSTQGTPAPATETLAGLPPAEDDLLGGKEGYEVVLNSALNSLRSKMQAPVTPKKEEIFQDLLTPAQAQTSAKETDKKPEENAQKEAVVNELTKTPKEDVVDQVIREKEEDKHKKSVTMMSLLSGAAALVGLKKKLDDTKIQVSSEQDLPVLETKSTQEQPAPAPADQPAEKQPLDFDQNIADAPALTVANATPVAEQPAEQPVQEEPVQEVSLELTQAEPEPTQDMGVVEMLPPFPSELEAQSQPQEQPAPAQAESEPVQEGVLPSLDMSDSPVAKADPAQEQPEEVLEELVPNAQVTQRDDIITDADLKDAFTERKNQDDKSVEQLFGLASASTAVAASAASAEQTNPGTPEESVLPSLDETNNEDPLAQEHPKVNPNDMTEVELKPGSTYLISDFVPPTLSTPETGQAEAAQQPNEKENKKEETTSAGLVEMVTPTAQTIKTNEQKGEANEPTVSQIVLENPIKAKRGAALDIKTVPMVPEPADSDRLSVDGLDDINAQHDLKSADAEPTGKKTKAAVWLLILLLLAGAIYAMLAFMNIIPPQFNVLPGQKKAAVQAQQEEQLNEMLAPTEAQLPIQTVDENTPVAVGNPQDAILEEVKNYTLPNAVTLKSFIESKHPAATELITWEISTAVDPDNYSILVKVPPENPQSFKISYRFNYNAVTKALDPTISDAKNLLDSAQAQVVQQAAQ